MATFTDAEKKQLWELFSNDTDDLTDGSSFLLAISDFEAEDLAHPTYGLVTGVQVQLASLITLDSDISDDQSAGAATSKSIPNQYSITYASGSNSIQGKTQQKSQVIESIRQKMKFEQYIGDPMQSRVLGVQAMYARNGYGRGYDRRY